MVMSYGRNARKPGGNTVEVCTSAIEPSRAWLTIAGKEKQEGFGGEIPERWSLGRPRRSSVSRGCSAFTPVASHSGTHLCNHPDARPCTVKSSSARGQPPGRG